MNTGKRAESGTISQRGRQAAQIFLKRPDAVILLVTLILLTLHLKSTVVDPDWLKPTKAYRYALHMSFQPQEDTVSIATYVPRDSVRQRVLWHSMRSPGLDQKQFESSSGTLSRWTGAGSGNNSGIAYEAFMELKAVRYSLDADIHINALGEAPAAEYLQATEVIPTAHPEIVALWDSIKPAQNHLLLPVLRSIFDYTAGLETLPFKGTTDALTALRLGAASCNGKSRLFVALARLNGIPSRLVGGVILNEGSKKTSHQWVEVHADGQWIPFDPTNGHFAELPEHYMELYRGDESLFKHTASIGFDYLFHIHGETRFSSLHADAMSQYDGTPELQNSIFYSFARALGSLELSHQAIAAIVLMPFCGLVITFLRNMVGLPSFGIFMPMLIASACTFVGIVQGMSAFLVVVFIAFVGHRLLHPWRLLKIPRLAAIISFVNIVVIALLASMDSITQFQIGMLSLFPVIIISFIAEKLHDLSEDSDWLELLKISAGTAVSIGLCYAGLMSSLLLNLFLVFPELYLATIAALIFIGRWTGIRLFELFRFRRILSSGAPVLGINGRNRDIVYRRNRAEDLRTAADKLRSKSILGAAGIPVPKTLKTVSGFAQLSTLSEFFDRYSDFVLKPNAGCQGRGIVVVAGRQEDDFLSAGGRRLSRVELHNHVAEIINGNYSQLGDSDVAYFEERVQQQADLNRLSPSGLCDIRLIITENTLVSAMLRIPTQESNGKANLHQGAIGAAIDLQTGCILSAVHRGKDIDKHPQSGEALTGFLIPHWSQIVSIGMECYAAFSLGYIGVDICIDEHDGPMVLEVNGRPGLEIQNIQQRGFRDDILNPETPYTLIA